MRLTTGSARSKRTTTPFAFAWRVTYDIDGAGRRVGRTIDDGVTVQTRRYLLADGNRVQPMELSDLGYKAIFYREISGKTLPQINSYWTTLIFTGKGKPPKNIDANWVLAWR